MENSIAGYMIWRVSPEIFSFSGFTLRWSALLFVLAFLISRQLLLNVFKKEGKPIYAVSYLCIYLAVVAMAGARLGYLIFYEPRSIFSQGLTVVFPFSFDPDFHLLDARQFSLHGAAVAVLIFLWLYSRKNPLNQKYLQTLDKVGLVSAVSGIFLFMSSFFGGGVDGRPTDSFFGVVSISPVESGLMKLPCCIMRSPDGKNPLERVEVRRDPDRSNDQDSKKSLVFYLFFKPGASERLVNEFLIGDVKTFLYEMPHFVHEPGDQPLHYRIFMEQDGKYIARVRTMGIARYPVAFFEAVTCFLIFVFLWYHPARKSVGKLFGLFTVLFWSLHSAFAFLTEDTAAVEIVLNGLFILMGVTVLTMLHRKAYGSTTTAKEIGEEILFRKD